ncbi:flagellar basal body rod protein FlgC [Priestia koreensis]|uniref:flagellar basal body rod protein FlgC n=1 Tax=Priestia koreensis TaxID=284581 RepID=UPI003459ED35
MSMFDSLNSSSSALTAQRLRMDVISSNMANADTTRAKLVNGKWEPYKRKMVEVQSGSDSFHSMFNKFLGGKHNSIGDGVIASKIVEDQTPFKLVYDPTHPDADAQGYVKMPNVDPLKETVDLMSSTRSYEANVTVVNATKGMLLKALEIGK